MLFRPYKSQLLTVKLGLIGVCIGFFSLFRFALLYALSQEQFGGSKTKFTFGHGEELFMVW